MKRILSLAAISLALMLVSCNKENPDPDRNGLARTTITTKSDAYEDTTTSFGDVSVKKTSDIEGQSWFVARSNGKMVHDAFLLSIYFDDINSLSVGQTLPISRFVFSFIYSNDSDATTYDYGGSVSLALKADDHIVLDFHNVSFSCAFGDYVTDGLLSCPLLP